MTDRILIKRSLTSGSIPSTASLEAGELAINVPDGKLFLKQSGSNTEVIRTLLTLDTPMSGNILLTGSLTLLGNSSSITGSLYGTSSWTNNATSASYAPTILPSGIVSSSAQVDYTQIQNTPSTIATASYVEYDNVVNKPTLISSSVQINTGSFSGSFVGEFTGTSSFAISSSIATDGIVTASVSNTTITFTKGDGSQFNVTVSQSGSVESASYAVVSETATSASYAFSSSYAPTILPPGIVSSSTQVDYTQLQNIPIGIVSSSVQINTGSFSGSFVGNFIGTSSWAENAISASYAPTILPSGVVSSSTQIDYTQIQNTPTTIPTASYVEYTNVANVPSLISSSAQVSYTEIQNIPSGIVSSSTQVKLLLPTGTVSSSVQINTGSFSGSFTGNFIGTSSWASRAISASFATTASAATSITFIPTTASFATSASYAPTILPSGVVSSSTQVNYTQLQNIPVGIVSSSAQINTGSFSGSFVGTFIGTSSWANNAISSSYAPTILPSGTVSSSAQVDYAQLQNIPSGIVSSSLQINTGSFSGSFTGTLIGTSSWANNAVSASYAPPTFIDNFVTVGQLGSTTQFNSIKAAVDSITDASVNNTYTVKVYPGIYIEDTITLKPYIAIKGESSTSTIVSASNPANTIFVMADQTMVIDMQIQGSTGTNASAVVYSSPTTPQTNAIAYVENVRFGTNYTNAKVVGSGSSGNCILQCSNVKYGGFTSGSKSFDVGFYVTSGSDGGIGRMQLRNVTSTNGGVAGTDNDQIFALADAPGCTFIVNGCLLTRSTGAARGTGFKVYNGGQLRLTGVNFQRWIRGIWAPQTGSAPSIDAIALNFENCTTDVAIEHTGSLGKVQGTDNFLKTQIAFAAPLYEVGQDARRISVAKKGGDFTSISASVAYITDSDENNRYVIEVGPGQYTENMIDLTNKPYVSIVGSNIQTTQIFPSQSNHPIVKMGINNEISFLTLAGAGSGQAAIYVDDIGDFAQAHKISIYDSDIGVYVNASTTDTQFYGEYIDINGTFTYGAYVSSSNEATAQCNLENYYLFPSASAAIGNYTVGPSSSVSLYAAKFQGDGTVNSTAIKLENGATLESTGLDIQNADYGLVIPAGGNGPNFRIVGGMIHDSTTYDFDIQNANTRGRYQGVSDHSKINNNSEDFYWNFLDDTDGENDITRKLSVTFADGTHTDATTLIFNGSPMGVMSGGEITISSGLTITTAAGFGYCENPLDNGVYKRIDWNNSNITLSANTNNYIYINYNGILSAAGSAPSSLENIILGRVVTNDTGVEFIDQTPYDGAHMSNKISKFNREALGPVFAEGSIVSENVTPFKLDVTQGSYFFSENNFLPVGTSSINLTQYYQSASVWARYTSSVVPNNVYASSSALVPMSASAYTKHTVYLVGQGVDEEYFLVINTNQYSSLVATENADLPTIPTYFNDGVVPLAAVYVQSGSANITQIQDIRPIIGFRAAGVNASSVHGNLLGLSADDHTQYLLVNGGRAMAGTLSLGGNNITNVGTMEGTASWATNAINAITASAATSITFIPTSASFATSASYAPTILPVGTVSSSLQINTGSFSGSFTGNFIGTSSWASNAVSSSRAVTSSFAISSSFAPTILPTGIVSSSTQVNYTQLQNIPSGIVSSSTQVINLLPTGTVSSSVQINTGSFSGSFTGTFAGTSSWAQSSSVATSSSFASTAPYSGLTGTPSGIVSSSTQVTTLLPAGTVSSSTQVNYTQLQNIPSGIVSSSTQVIALLPAGTVSSSLQINTGSFSGSFTGNFIGTSSWSSNTISSSFATTSSFAVSSSWAPTTSTFPFIGNAVISGSLVVSGSATSSLTINSDRITVAGSASFTGPISGTHAVFSQMYNENSTVAGVYLGRNTTDNTPRIGFFNGTTAENWQIDNNGGQFRWYTPSVTRLTLTRSGVNTVLRLLGSGSVITSEGSISASNGITGSLLGTASNATSASFASTASFVNILNQTVSASGNIEAGTNLVSNNSSGDEGGELLLAKPQTNSTIAGTGVTIDVYQNKLRIFEQGGTARGGYWDITSLAAGVGTNLAGGAGTVTSVTAGDGLTGGTITGAGTITIDTGSAHFITGSISAINLKGVVSSSTQINTGSFSGSFTGTLIGTSSWANNSTSASFATTASFALNAGAGSGFPFSGSAVITGSLLVSGSGLQVTGSTTVLGAFQATTKSFKIDHQRIAGKSLIYGVLEGPEHAVYVRGRVSVGLTGAAIVQLPEEWEWLVDEDSITVQLTSIGTSHTAHVKEIGNNRVIIESDISMDCFYLIHATRKDVPMLDTVQ